MRLSRPPSWDFTASALISVFALFLVHLSPPSIQGFSTILGFLLAIPLSGYLLMLSLFPAQSDLGSRRRALLSLGASTFLAAIAYVRRSALPPRKRLVFWSIRGRRSGRFLASSPLAGTKVRFVSLLFVLIIICAITASVFTNYANQSSSSEKIKKGDSASPYREDYLWINSLDIKSR